MLLGIAEDFSLDRNIVFDAQLKANPDSGQYINVGVHPAITIDNLLTFLPDEFVVSNQWDAAATYNSFEDTRDRANLVVHNNVLYQSLIASNTGNTPDASPASWLKTNVDSLMIKSLIYKAQAMVKTDLNLNRRLISNEFLYEIGKSDLTLPNDYAGWVFEARGSDYVSITINQISFQKKGTGTVDLYVVNEGTLVDTLQISHDNGKVVFQDLNYSFSGRGKWMFVIDSTDVIVGTGYVENLKDGFVTYTTSGIGNAPETAEYSYGSTGNGLGFNVSVSLESDLYLKNNFRDFGGFVKAAFEYQVFQMFLYNPNNVSSREQRLRMDKDILIAELKSLEADTVVRRYHREKKRAIQMVSKTLDSQLDDTNDFEITLSSI